MEIIRRMIALNKRQTKEQNRAFVMECPLPEYDELTHDGRLGELAQRIDKSTDDEEQRLLKVGLTDGASGLYAHSEA